MGWMAKIRCFFTFKNPLSFYRRNYESWEVVPPDSVQELEESGDYIILRPDKEEDGNSPEEGDSTRVNEENHDSSTRNEVDDEKNDVSDHSPMVVLIEKPFIKRNGFTLLRLAFQSFGLSLAISFSLSFPALLQLIPLDLRLAFVDWLRPFSFILNPVVELYRVLRQISVYIQGYDPTWLYVMAEGLFRRLMNAVPFLPKLPDRPISWDWESPAGEIDKPELAPQHRRMLGILHRIVPNQWVNLALLWLFTAIPLFFLLSSRLGRQMIELMPEKVYLKRLQGLNKVLNDCKAVSIVAVRKNRMHDESGRYGQVLKALRFLSRYGIIFAFVLPVFLGIVLAFI